MNLQNDLNCWIFFEKVEKGKSGRNKFLGSGDLPLITTSETMNGISSLVNRLDVKKVYLPGHITISSNGGSCCAFYHDYEFAANGDVFVCTLKPRYDNKSFGMLLCTSINSEKWRYNYYRKFNSKQLDALEISLPVDTNSHLDFKAIEKFSYAK